MNKLLFSLLICLLVIPFVFGLSVNIPGSTTNFTISYTYTNISTTNYSNSTDFWITTEGHLDDVSDILGSEITNDLGWITSAGTFDGNASSICSGGEVLLGNGTCWDATDFPTDTGSDTWSTNYTDYWNSTQINDILSGNNTDWSSTFNQTYHDNINTDSWSGNYTDYYNATIINLIVSGNATGTNISNLTYNWRTENNGTLDSLNLTWFDNVLGYLSFKTTQLESWLTGQLTDYYNKTQIDNNLSNYAKYEFLNNNFNGSGNFTTTGIGTFGGLNITDSGAHFSGGMENERGTFGFPNVEIGEDTYPTIIFDDGSDTWMIDFLTGSGLRFYQSGNVHMIVNTDGILTDENITASRYCNSTNCYTIDDFLTSVGSSYNLTYHNYISNNISNMSYYWNNLSSPSNILISSLTPGDLNLTDYSLTLAYLNGTYGSLNINTYPWILEGATLELREDLIVGGGIFPNATLKRDIGSGPLRWNVLWVSNISSENIDNSGYITSNSYCNASGTCRDLSGWGSGVDMSLYYLRTVIDNNFSLYMSIDSWNSNLTNIYNQINLNNTNAKIYANSIVVSNDTWRTNYTHYYNGTIVNQIVTGNISTDTWGLNHTFYYNKTQVDNNFSLYYLQTTIIDMLTGNSTAWLSTFNQTYHDNVNTDSWSLNYTDYYNGTKVNEIVQGNITAAEIYANTILSANISANYSNWITTFNQTYHDNVNTDSWSLNYTDYYNGTKVNEIVQGNITDVYVALNLNITASNIYANTILANNISANYSNWISTFNQTYHDNVNTDSWSLNYTDYYNKTLIDNNFSNYLTKTQIDSYNYNSTFNQTYSNLLNQDCPTGEVVNGTYPNGTLRCYSLSSTYYNATSSQIVKGNLDGGSLVDTQHPDGNYDSITFNFSETAGSPGLDLRVNFSGVSSFNRGVMRYKTSSLSGDYPVRQLYNYDTSSWDSYPTLAQSEDFSIVTQPIFVGSKYIQNNVIQMRLYKTSNGNTNNHYYIDWVAMVKGFGTPSGQEVDPFWNADKGYYWNATQINSILSANNTAWLSTFNQTYHDYVDTDTWSLNYTFYPTKENMYSNLSTTLLANGTRAMTGDLNMNNNNITNVKNISFGGSNNIYGNGTCIKIQGSTSLLEIC